MCNHQSNGGSDLWVDPQEVLTVQFGRRPALLGAALLALSACSSSGSYTDKQSSKQGPVTPAQVYKANIPTPRTETVVLTNPDFTVFDNWNNLIPNGAPLGSGFHAVCMESMFMLDPVAGKVMPWLAEKWDYNDSFTELTITFNPKVTWSDGQPMGAEDFQYTMNLAVTRTDLFRGGGDFTEFVKETKVVDKHTAVIVFKRANPRFHYHFINVLIESFDIKPKHIWSKQDPKKFKDSPPVRTGPYRLKQVIKSQKMFVWERNDNYWNKDAINPKPKFYIVHALPPQADAAALLFEHCQVDGGGLDGPHAAVLKAKNFEPLAVAQHLDPCPRGLWMNCSEQRGVMKEPKMHWAISYLVDRETIGQKLAPVKADAAQLPWAPYESNKKYDFPDLVKKYPITYDPKKAAALLDEICPKGSDGKRMYAGKPVSLEIITPIPPSDWLANTGNMLKKELEAVGIPSSFKTLSGSVFDEKNGTGEFDITIGWSCDFRNDPADVIRPYRIKDIVPIGTKALRGNNLRLKDEKMDEISIKLASLDPSTPEAMTLFAQGMERYFERLPFSPMVQNPGDQYFNTTFWKGWPEGDNVYALPYHWWGQFILVLAKLEPTGREEPK